jgi:hypothetical protein
MKKLSITDSEKKLLFIILALGILAASYFFGFTKLNEKAAEIEASNQADQATVTKLEGMVAKQAETEAETQKYKDNIKKIIAKYPSNIKQDKTISLVQDMQDEIEIDISSITFSMNKQVQAFSGDNKSVGKYALLNLSYTCDYDQFKNLLAYVKEFPDRTTIPFINATYDQKSGKLKGAINYKMYYLTNTDKKYVDYDETGIPEGKAGIFYPDDWYPLQEFDELMEELEALEQQ